MEGEEILYEVRGQITIITLNQPTKLNALNGPQYLQLGKFIEQADKEEDTLVTIVQSTGRYFSSGANIADKRITKVEALQLFLHEYWLDNFVARNAFLGDLFQNHTKILVASLNGPVIGLSAALVSLCDLVYCYDEAKTFLLAPFANLGLVAEGAASATLFARLGWSKLAEALLLARPIPGPELISLGFINKLYKGTVSSVEEFNNKVAADMAHYILALHPELIIQNKQLLKNQRDLLVSLATQKELVMGFNKWVQGIPQTRFVQLKQKEIKHKM